MVLFWSAGLLILRKKFSPAHIFHPALLLVLAFHLRYTVFNPACLLTFWKENSHLHVYFPLHEWFSRNFSPCKSILSSTFLKNFPTCTFISSCTSIRYQVPRSTKKTFGFHSNRIHMNDDFIIWSHFKASIPPLIFRKLHSSKKDFSQCTAQWSDLME